MEKGGRPEHQNLMDSIRRRQAMHQNAKKASEIRGQMLQHQKRANCIRKDKKNKRKEVRKDIYAEEISQGGGQVGGWNTRGSIRRGERGGWRRMEAGGGG